MFFRLLLILCTIVAMLFTDQTDLSAQKYEYTTDSLKKYAKTKADRVGNSYWYDPGRRAIGKKIYFSDVPRIPLQNTFKVLEAEQFTIIKYIREKKNRYGSDFYKIQFDSGKIGYLRANEFELYFCQHFQDSEWSDHIYSESPERIRQKRE